MGQQQLLLLVLGIVIVSIAVYVGIDLVNRSARQRHVDLLVNHTVMVSAEAVAWRLKASPFLGGGGSFQDLEDEGMKSLIMAEDRLPGRVKITLATADVLEITAVSDVYPEIGIRTRVEGEEIVETIVVYDGSITLPD